MAGGDYTIFLREENLGLAILDLQHVPALSHDRNLDIGAVEGILELDKELDVVELGKVDVSGTLLGILRLQSKRYTIHKRLGDV